MAGLPERLEGTWSIRSKDACLSAQSRRVARGYRVNGR